MSAVIVAAPASRWPTAHRSWRTPCRPASAWSGSGFLVSLPDGPQYTNHLGTVHASALLAAAEAGSGAFLVRQFGEASGYLPVVRRLEAKFRKPPGGALPPGLVVPVEEVWDRRRGRERETYTLQGYSPVLGNRPPELNSPGGLQKPVVLVSSNEGASPADQRGQGSRASTRYSIT